MIKATINTRRIRCLFDLMFFCAQKTNILNRNVLRLTIVIQVSFLSGIQAIVPSAYKQRGTFNKLDNLHDYQVRIDGRKMTSMLPREFISTGPAEATGTGSFLPRSADRTAQRGRQK